MVSKILQCRFSGWNSFAAGFMRHSLSVLLRSLLVAAVACAGTGANAGPTGPSKAGSNTPDSPSNGGNERSKCSVGMPTYTVDAPLVSLRITDTPIGCRSPIGPAVPMTLSYTQDNSTQPATQNFGNVGPRWYLNWVSYIQDNPLSLGSGIVRVPMGGGAIPYTGAYNASTGAINPDGFTLGSTRDRLYLASASPVRYELRKADGSKQVFSHSDGSTASPRRVFLTQVVDSVGNALSLTYDNNHRLVQLTDAIGRNTTLQYNNAGNSLLITDIYDPFGRHAQIGYDASARLNSITDVIGMTSTFTYNGSGIISAMTTPYGTTTFSYGGSVPNNWINVTDPLAKTERVEFNQGVSGIPYSDPQYPSLASRGLNPQNAWQNYRNVYFWDKSVHSLYPGDYTKARIQHLLHDGSNSSATNMLESTKTATGNRVLYLYPGLIDGGLRSGGTDLPWLIAQRLPDGSTAVTEKTYNALGNVTRIIEPVGRKVSYTYAGNLIDMLQKSETGPAGLDVVTATYTYNSQHLPVTYTDAAGLTISYTYNSAGQVTNETDSNGRVTSRAYDGNGYLLSVTRPDGVVSESYTYDAVGRIASETDAVGYTRSYIYDNLDRITRITHPDGSHEDQTWNRLDLASYSDRAGQVTSYSYDALRRLVSETNPLGQVTGYSYYPGGQLKTKTDANGKIENWSYDVEGRVTSYTNAVGQITTYGYDSAGRLSTIAEPTGQATTRTYDANGRLTQTSLSASGMAARITTYTYTPDGQLKSTVQPDGRSTNYTYDNALRLVAVTDTLGNSINYTLDNRGNRTKEEIKDIGGVLQRSIDRNFDVLNQLQQVTGATR
jgi:YD repeat-containing protein